MTVRPITMAQAYKGLERFIAICNPARITWGDLYRLDWDEKGIKAGKRLAVKLEKNIILADQFLVAYCPTQLESYCIDWFLKMTREHLAILDVELSKRVLYLEKNRTLEEIVDGWEAAMREDEKPDYELPF